MHFHSECAVLVLFNWDHNQIRSLYSKKLINHFVSNHCISFNHKDAINVRVSSTTFSANEDNGEKAASVSIFRYGLTVCSAGTGVASCCCWHRRGATSKFDGRITSDRHGVYFSLSTPPRDDRAND